MVLAVTEKEVQKSIFAWLDMMANSDPLYSLFFAIPNGAHLARGAVSAKSLKAQGMKPGVPDILGAIPAVIASTLYHGLFIEMKSEIGKVSPDQDLWHLRLRKTGYRVEVLRSFEEAQYVITQWISHAYVGNRRGGVFGSP